MFTHLINILLYPKGVYNMKIGLTVWEDGDVWNSRRMGSALATGNGCGWWRGKWWGC